MTAAQIARSRRSRADAVSVSRPSTTVPAGQRDELVEGHREHRVRRAARRPDLGVAGEVLVDDRRERRRVAGGRDAADRLTGRLAHLLRRSRAGCCSRPSRSASAAVSTRCAPLVITSSGSPSDQNTRLFAIAPTSTPSAAAASGGGGCGIRQHDDLAGDAGGSERVVDDAAARGKLIGHPTSLGTGAPASGSAGTAPGCSPRCPRTRPTSRRPAPRRRRRSSARGSRSPGTTTPFPRSAAMSRVEVVRLQRRRRCSSPFPHTWSRRPSAARPPNR